MWSVVFHCVVCFVFFFFKQKTAYEMRISDWSSDVCSSDLLYLLQHLDGAAASSSRAYALSAWSAFSVACVVTAAVVASWHALREWKTVLATLLLGLASVGAIGFSPTVYASGDRIHFVCQAALLLVALRLVAALEHEFGTRTAKVSIAIVAVVAAYRVLRLLG